MKFTVLNKLEVKNLPSNILYLRGMLDYFDHFFRNNANIFEKDVDAGKRPCG